MGDHIRLRANTLITKAIAYDGWLIDSEGHSEAFRVGDAVCDARCSSQRHSVRDTSLVDLSVLTNMEEAPLSIAPPEAKGELVSAAYQSIAHYEIESTYDAVREVLSKLMGVASSSIDEENAAQLELCLAETLNKHRRARVQRTQ